MVPIAEQQPQQVIADLLRCPSTLQAPTSANDQDSSHL
jgi:hypothetical protein